MKTDFNIPVVRDAEEAKSLVTEWSTTGMDISPAIILRQDRTVEREPVYQALASLKHGRLDLQDAHHMCPELMDLYRTLFDRPMDQVEKIHYSYPIGAHIDMLAGSPQLLLNLTALERSLRVMDIETGMFSRARAIDTSRPTVEDVAEALSLTGNTFSGVLEFGDIALMKACIHDIGAPVESDGSVDSLRVSPFFSWSTVAV